MSAKYVTVVVLTLLQLQIVAAQEGTWSVSVSANGNHLNMATVNETLDNTVAAWNSNYIPIGPYAHFNNAISYSSKIAYRFDREFGFTLSVSDFSRMLTDSYEDPIVVLKLNRSVGASDVMFGLVYYLPPLLYSAEPYVLLRVREGSVCAQMLPGQTSFQRGRKPDERVAVL